VFDKDNQKHYTFINGGTANEVDYYYAPEFQLSFPRLKEWALLVDYNKDGLEDIFTFAGAFTKIYKAFYKNDTVQFELMDSLYYKNTSGFPSNINIPRTDLPTISDLNGDGDIDVLTFDMSGIHIEYYENLQVENNLPLDSVFFEKVDDCWGNISENATDAGLNIGVACKGNDGTITNQNNNNLHQGSTLLAFDYDGDLDKDILIGDLGSSALSLLLNGGNTSNATIEEVIGNFPAENTPVDIYKHAAAYYLDVDNDCISDLLTSHNSTNDTEDHDHVWRYKNEGDHNNHQFTFKQNNFLLDDMIDVGTLAVPAVADINGDGKDDLLIGNQHYFDKADTSTISKMVAYLNVSTDEEIRFQFFDDDFGNLSEFQLTGLFPTFGDIDLDGDLDLICGDEKGFFHYFKNTAELGEPMFLQLAQLNIDSVQSDTRAIPFLYDYDEDGLLDIIAGSKQGVLIFIKNTGNSDEIHLEIKNLLFGNVKEIEIGNPLANSAPFISPLSKNNSKPYLLVHSYSGKIAIFDDLQADQFTKIDTSYNDISTGGGGGIAVSDFNQDGYYEIVVGAVTGGLQLLSQKLQEPQAIKFSTKHCAIDTITNIIEYPIETPNLLLHTDNQSLTIDGNIQANTPFIILNLEGQQILAGNLHNNQIALHNLPKGMYFLNLKLKNTITYRFIVK